MTTDTANVVQTQVARGRKSKYAHDFENLKVNGYLWYPDKTATGLTSVFTNWRSSPRAQRKNPDVVNWRVKSCYWVERVGDRDVVGARIYRIA